MRELFSNFFDYFILFYSGSIITSYILMVYLAWRKHIKRKIFHDPQYTIQLLRNSPYTPGISIVAPAYNEEMISRCSHSCWNSVSVLLEVIST